MTTFMASNSKGAPANADCGCDYPDYINPIVPQRSNQIMHQLLHTISSLEMHQKAAIFEELGKLPRVLVLKVGNTQTTVLHGDAHSLSGWKYAVEIMEPKEANLQSCWNVPQHLATSGILI
jgi:hypothetical protein